MAVRGIFFLFSIVLTIIGTNAAGRFTILHSPDSLKFTDASDTMESTLKDIFSASLGLSVDENSEWNGLSITDPFKTPEAVVEVHIDGVPSLGDQGGIKGRSYDLLVDEYETDTYEVLKHRIKQRFTAGENNTLINANLNNPDDLTKVLGGIKLPKSIKHHAQYLKPSVEEDQQFLQELSVLKTIADKVKSGAIVPDNNIDFYYLRFRSLHALSDFHGPNSLKTKEAKKLLAETLQQLNNAFVKAYDGSVVVSVVTTDIAHTRRAVRSVGAENRLSTKEDDYSADYAAIFNMILWFGVVFSFALIAIVYAIMDMDPGRDSIIYRMTSTRMKKDN